MTRVQTELLSYQVFVAPPELTALADQRPGGQFLAWSPTSSTLIAGARDAVLVDPLFTTTQAHALANWIASTGKNLTSIYITHGHGDHFFGLSVILDRFPNARAVATPDVVDYMREQVQPAAVAGFWGRLFPGQIPERLVTAQPLAGGTFELEGHQLAAVELGHTDTHSTTCLHVPDLGLVVAGDAVYNDVHLYLVESTSERRQEWLAALDTIESLAPRAIIAGHKRAELDDDPRNLEETRRYIRDFDEVAADSETAQELYHRMLARHPGRTNPGALWASARSVKPSRP